MNSFIAKRWLPPVALLALTTVLWLAWWRIDPRLMAIRYITAGSPPRNYVLGIRTLDLFPSLLASLKVVAWIGLGGSLLTTLIAWLRPHWLGAAVVFSVTAILYALSASLAIQEQSGAPHYVYLADAFAHGRLHLAARPPNAVENDWTLFQGQWSVSFPPVPALLMLPFVAIAGLDFNDVIFTLLFGALNVALFYQMLPLVGRQLSRPFEISSAARVGLTLAFGFGTVHWWLSTNGQVWFTAQIIATTFLLLTLIETLGAGRALLVGLWLGLAALARPTILFAIPPLAWLLLERHSLRQLAKGLIPLGILALGMVWYNFARYGSPLDLGYQHMQLERLLAKRLAEHGSFSLAYLGDNAYHAFLNLPAWRNRWPFLILDGWGLSLLLSTPIIIAGIVAPWRGRLAQAMLAAAILVAIPNLLYYNTGYLQAGYRYALDFLPFLLVLAALGMRGRLKIWTALLILLSVIMGFLSVVNFISLSFEIL